MKFNFPVNNFTAGEWSPKMASRTDTQEYLKSCEEVTNFFIQMQGGAQYRGNTDRLSTEGELVDRPAMNAALVGNNQPTASFKVIPYQNSNEALKCVLVIHGNGVFEIIKSVLGLQSITYGANTSTIGWLPQNTQYQQIGDLLFLTSSDGAFKPKVFSYANSYNNPYKPAGIGKYYLEDIDRDYVPTNPWRTVPFTLINALDSSVTITSPATTTVNTSQAFTSSAPYFTSSMVGKYIRLANSTTVDGIFRITAYTNSTTVTGLILRTMTASFTYGSATNAASFWQASDWGADVGYPKTVTAFQGRLIFGGTAAKPDTIWGSRISNVLEFQEVPDVSTTGIGGYASGAFTSDNSRPFTLTPNTAQSSNIVALSSSKTLNIHTDKLEIVAYGSNGALGPVNVVFDSSSSFGASPVQPVRVNNYSTYVQANGFRIRDLTYSFNEDQYKSQDLGFAADHLFTRTSSADIDGSDSGLVALAKFPVDDIQEIVRYENRSSILLCKTRAGKLFYVTLDRDYQVTAWGRIVIGTDTTQVAPYNSQPKVLSLCVDPITTRVLLLVERTFNGAKKLCVELLHDPTETLNTNYNAPDYYNFSFAAPYLDCAWYCAVQPAQSVPTTLWCINPTVTGSTENKYPGATVSVIADGNYIGEVTISTTNGGNFTLPVAASEVRIGYKYPGRLVTSGLEQGGQIGTPVGRIKRIDEIVTRFYRTGSGKVGGSSTTMEEIAIRSAATPMNQPTPYFSGDKTTVFPAGYERKAQVIIEQDKPYPMYVVSVAARGVTYD